MKSGKIMNSKIYRILDYILRLVLLNFLIVIPSFSFSIVIALTVKDQNTIWSYIALIPTFFLLFPCIVAVADVIKRYEEKDTNTVFKDFFKSFQKHFVKALLASVLLIIIFVLLYNSVKFFWDSQSNGIIYIMGLFFSISFVICGIFVLSHLPLVLIYFSDLRFVESLKLTFIMAFKDFGMTLLMTIGIVAIAAFSIISNYVMLFISFSLIDYLIIKLSFKQYMKLYRRVADADKH